MQWMTRFSGLMGVLVLVTTAHAEVVSKDAESVVVRSTGEYVLGSADTQADGRRAAIERAKNNAVEEMGTFVRIREAFSDGQKVDQVRTLIAGAFIKTDVLKTDRRVGDHDRIVASATIRAKLDRASMEAEMERVQENAQLKERLRRLQAENAELRDELAEGDSQLAPKDGGAKMVRETAKNLEATYGKAQKVIEPGKIARILDKAARENANERARKDAITDAFYYEGLAKAMNVRLGTIEATDRHTIQVEVLFDWPHDQIVSMLRETAGAVRKQSGEDLVIYPHLKGIDPDAFGRYGVKAGLVEGGLCVAFNGRIKAAKIHYKYDLDMGTRYFWDRPHGTVSRAFDKKSGTADRAVFEFQVDRGTAVTSNDVEAFVCKRTAKMEAPGELVQREGKWRDWRTDLTYGRTP